MLSISFASNGYYKQQDDWAESCRRSGIKDVFCAREKDIPSEFVSFGDRGFGFWQWKSHLIKKYIKETDLLIYTDVDYNIVNSYDLLAMAKASREPCLLFEYPFAQRIWTKRDCFYYMGCDEQKYWDANHLEAGISIWKGVNECEDLISEWIANCADRRVLSDDPNECGLENLPEFKDHRHDQSVLTNLTTKAGITPHPISALRGSIINAVNFSIPPRFRKK